jgi:hypothetical protein
MVGAPAENGVSYLFTQALDRREMRVHRRLYREGPLALPPRSLDPANAKGYVALGTALAMADLRWRQSIAYTVKLC